MTNTMQKIAEFLHNKGYYGTTAIHQEFLVMLMQYCSELETRIKDLEAKVK